MRVVSISVAMVLLAGWEWPNLGHWGAGERWAFWISWALMCAWAVMEQLRVPIPSLAGVQARILAPLAQRYLTPHPNAFW